MGEMKQFYNSEKEINNLCLYELKRKKRPISTSHQQWCSDTSWEAGKANIEESQMIPFPPLSLSFCIRADVIWYGTSLWLIWVS